MCEPSMLDQLLHEIEAYARHCFGDDLESVILYGSYARGDADEESDLDVMVLVRQTPQQLLAYRKQWNSFGTDLDLKYNLLTSCKLQDSDTFHQWKTTLPFFRNVDKEGVRISA